MLSLKNKFGKKEAWRGPEEGLSPPGSHDWSTIDSYIVWRGKLLGSLDLSEFLPGQLKSTSIFETINWMSASFCSPDLQLYWKQICLSTLFLSDMIKTLILGGTVLSFEIQIWQKRRVCSTLKLY